MWQYFKLPKYGAGDIVRYLMTNASSEGIEGRICEVHSSRISYNNQHWWTVIKYTVDDPIAQVKWRVFEAQITRRVG